MRVGFEPTNLGFADPAIRPLWYRTIVGERDDIRNRYLQIESLTARHLPSRSWLHLTHMQTRKTLLAPRHGVEPCLSGLESEALPLVRDIKWSRWQIVARI